MKTMGFGNSGQYFSERNTVRRYSRKREYKSPQIFDLEFRQLNSWISWNVHTNRSKNSLSLLANHSIYR